MNTKADIELKEDTKKKCKRRRKIGTNVGK